MPSDDGAPKFPGGSGGRIPACEVVPQVRRAATAFAGVAVAAAWGGGPAHQVTIGPPPPRDTHAVLAGGLCQDNRCTCRGETGDGGVGVPDNPERKRYEMRLGSALEL